MINASTCYLVSYKINEKNSVKGEPQSYNYPGHDSELALDIDSIALEAKISVLKALKIGDIIEFNIKQDVDVPNSNYKKDGNETVDYYCEGTGSGEIKNISELDQTLSDDEYQEVTIHLVKGYAEGL